MKIGIVDYLGPSIIRTAEPCFSPYYLTLIIPLLKDILSLFCEQHFGEIYLNSYSMWLCPRALDLCFWMTEQSVIQIALLSGNGVVGLINCYDRYLL